MSTSAPQVEHTHQEVELDMSSEEDSRGERIVTVWRR
jgi:hypothetical protein